MKIRLQKFMADAGIASRRACEKMILQGRVKVNGHIVKEVGIKIDPEKDRVEVDGRVCRRNVELVYIMLNKPKGVISTAKDPFGRIKVVDLVDDLQNRIYPVGRLDRDTEGLLILTNDGEVTYKLTHPKHEIEKTYIAQVKGNLSPKALKILEQGVNLEDGITSPAKARILKVYPDTTLVELKIREGRNRQVRRMFEKVGHPVLHLKRTAIGKLKLRGLKVGDWKYLNRKEVEYLKSL